MKARILRTLANPVAMSLLALIVFTGSLAALAAVAYADQYVNGGVAWGEDLPFVAHADANPLGVNLFLEKEVDPAKVEKTLQMTRDGGFRWVRQTFAWNDIEISAKGDFTDRRGPGPWVSSWEKYDRIVDGAQRYGLEIIARLDSPPVWARIPGDDVETFHKGPPANYNDYGDFVAAVAERYKGKIKYFQIWNEPNLHGEWGGHPVNPKEYTELLRVAHDAARKANPQAVIITAALAPTAEQSLANLNDVLFLEAMYREGAGKYFDILSTMIYGLGQPPAERRTDLKRLNFSRPILLRRVMEANGDASKPIWISEYAWLSLPADWDQQCAARPKDNPCGQNIWGRSVDEQTQGKWLVEGYERAQSEWPWMGVMCVWQLRVPDPVPGEPANYFAILRDDFSSRPAYNAIKEYSRRFPVADVGAYQTLSAAAAYSPAWDQYLRGAGAPTGVYSATIRFAGTRLDADLALNGTPATVSVDGGSPHAIPDRRTGRNNSRPEQVTLASGLPYGVHTALVQIDPAARNPATVKFEGFRVSRDRPISDTLSFLLLYGLTGLMAAASAAWGVQSLAAWAGAALNRPRERHAEWVRELARNGAAVVGTGGALLLYYATGNPALMLAALGVCWTLLTLKPSVGLAMLAAAIPFYWYPKVIGRQHFPVAETLTLMLLGSLMARRIVGFLLPGLAHRLHFDEALEWMKLPAHRRSQRTHSGVSIRAPRPTNVHPPERDYETLAPAAWPQRPVVVTPRVGLGTTRYAGHLLQGQVTGPLPVLDATRKGASATVTTTPLVEPEVPPSPPVTGPHTRIQPDGHGLSAEAAPLPYEGPTEKPAPRQGGAAPASRVRPWVEQFKDWNRQDAFAVPAVAMLVLGALSLLTLADPTFAKDSARAYRWTIVEPVLLYFLVTDIARTRRAMWRVADFFIAAGAAVALLGIWQFVTGDNTLDVEGVSRVFGVYQHPNNLALYLGRVLPLAACAGLFLPWGWRKLLYLLAALPLAATTLLTYSRGAYLGVTAAIVVGAVLGFAVRSLGARRRRGRARTAAASPARSKWPLWAGASALLVGGGLLALALLPRLPERISSFGSGTMRVRLWESAMRMLADHPVTGVGPDQFLNQFQAHYITPEQKLESYTSHPHNLVLDMWLSLGIIGLLVFVWLLLRYFREAVRVARRSSLKRDPASVALAAGLAALMVDFTVHGMVDNSYFLMDLAMIFWLGCGMLQVLRTEPAPRRT